MRQIEPKPSRLLGLLLLGMVMLALVAVYLAAIPGVIQWGLGMAVTGLGIWGWRRARFVEVFRVDVDGMLQCRDERGEWCELEVRGDSLATPLLMVLRYRTPAERVRTLVLLPDSAAAEDLRRLRVSLRWANHTRSDKASQGAG